MCYRPGVYEQGILCSNCMYYRRTRRRKWRRRWRRRRRNENQEENSVAYCCLYLQWLPAARVSTLYSGQTGCCCCCFLVRVIPSVLYVHAGSHLDETVLCWMYRGYWVPTLLLAVTAAEVKTWCTWVEELKNWERWKKKKKRDEMRCEMKERRWESFEILPWYTVVCWIADKSIQSLVHASNINGFSRVVLLF